MLDEVQQQLVLLRRELQVLVTANDRRLLGVDLHIPEFVYLGLAGPALDAIAAQQSLDPRHQLEHLERLHQVIVGTGAQALDPIHHLSLGREHQHRRDDARAAKVAADVEAVLFGQHQI